MNGFTDQVRHFEFQIVISLSGQVVVDVDYVQIYMNTSSRLVFKNVIKLTTMYELGCHSNCNISFHQYIILGMFDDKEAGGLHSFIYVQENGAYCQKRASSTKPTTFLCDKTDNGLLTP